MDAFLKYDNVLAYNVGNEVITLTNNTDAAPYVKAAARDSKAYLWVTSNILHFCLSFGYRKSKNSSTLIGYAQIDGTDDFVRVMADFLGCDSEADSIDIFGLNN